MDKKAIIEFLRGNGIEEVEEIPYQEGKLILRFFYDFDEDELKAAKAYANDESNSEKQDDEWYEEYFIPYLSDVAIDNVGDLIEDVMESFEVDVQYVSYDIDKDNCDYNEFVAVIFEKDEDVDIDNILEELQL